MCCCCEWGGGTGRRRVGEIADVAHHGIPGGSTNRPPPTDAENPMRLFTENANGLGDSAVPT